ncbi:MAG: tetratricopeptide repeat protein [Elusimicrobia bacterium]|nr:tetratricopeptide repeat protein [Elusimicrobiota bacterium]
MKNILLISLIYILSGVCVYAADNNTPEYYINQFNRYFSESRKEKVTVTTEKDGGSPVPVGTYTILPAAADDNSDSLAIADPNTKEIAGYMVFKENFNTELFKQALDYIDKGIKNFPDRLDMRFGKASACSEIKDTKCVNEIFLETLKRSVKNKNRWLWTDNKPLDDGKKQMLTSMQDYVLAFYHTELDEAFKELSENILKYYPDSVESLSNLGIYYSLQKDYDKGLIFFLKAEKLNPKDEIVLSNIAEAYDKKGDALKADEYRAKLLSLQKKD